MDGVGGVEKLMLKVTSASTEGGVEASAELGKNIKEVFYGGSGSRIIYSISWFDDSISIFENHF